MSKLFREEDKFLVIKREDIKSLPLGLQEDLNIIIEHITAKKIAEQRNPDAQYWVVNKDEPYSDIVKDLIFAHEDKIKQDKAQELDTDLDYCPKCKKNVTHQIIRLHDSNPSDIILKCDECERYAKP